MSEVEGQEEGEGDGEEETVNDLDHIIQELEVSYKQSEISLIRTLIKCPFLKETMYLMTHLHVPVPFQSASESKSQGQKCNGKYQFHYKCITAGNCTRSTSSSGKGQSTVGTISPASKAEETAAGV